MFPCGPRCHSPTDGTLAYCFLAGHLKKLLSIPLTTVMVPTNQRMVTICPIPKRSDPIPVSEVVKYYGI